MIISLMTHIIFKACLRSRDLCCSIANGSCVFKKKKKFFGVKYCMYKNMESPELGSNCFALICANMQPTPTLSIAFQWDIVAILDPS